MMKKYLVLVCASLWLAGGAARTEASTNPRTMVTMAEEAGKTCGTPTLFEEADVFIANTRRLHPELTGTLAKEGRTTYEVGDTLTFYTANWNTSTYEKTLAYCKYKSSQTYIFVGAEDLDNDRVNQAAVDSFYTAFELRTPPASVDPSRGIRRLENDYFGATPNKSGDGYVYILIYDIKDTYNPAGGKNVYIAGYFSPNDQLNNQYSNRKDLIYVDCYPQNPVSKSALATVAHEFQHLIHYGQDPGESSTGLWVNEGASEYAEVMCGFPLRSPSYFLQHPERSLLEFNNQDENLWDYRKVALWTYYLAEKFGPELIGEIIRDPGHSVDGVRSALIKRGISLSFEDLFTHFAIANYVDDPALEPNGYYSYNNLRLPTLPGSTVHSSYPLANQTKSLPQYATRYIRFTGIDSTAVLQVAGQLGGSFRGRVFESGSKPAVNPLALDGQMTGSYPLKAIGQTADADIFMAISLASNNTFTYSATTELRDITPPVLVSGPNEFVPTAQSITITWETDEHANSLVEYGLTSSYGNSMLDTTFTKSHSVTLSRLQPNTTYHYRVGSTDTQGNGPRFSVDFLFTTSTSQVKTVAQLQQAHAYGYSGRSQVHTPDGVLHLLYHEVSGDRRYVYHTATADRGATWKDVTTIAQNLFHSGMASLAVDKQGRLHAAWHARAESGDAKLAIYYSRSSDQGVSWSQPLRISSPVDNNDVLYAAIAVDDTENPHVVWNSARNTDSNSGDVYHNHSRDGGTTWQGDRMISSGGGTRYCFVPMIDFTPGGEAWVFWYDGLADIASQTRKVFCTRSSDYQNWTAPEAVTTSGVLYDNLPAMVIDDQGRVHLAYSDNYTPGDIRIMYRVYENGAWSTAIPIARSATGNVLYPCLSCDSRGTLFMLYLDDLGSAALGKYAVAPWKSDERPALRKTAETASDVFLSLNTGNGWTPGANLSLDLQDNIYAEMPRRQLPGGIDVVWMAEMNASSNALRYIHITTTLPPSSKPLGITYVHPASGATGVPYFKQSFYVQIDFDQRVITDSLTASNFIVSGAASGVISGLISYDASLRRLRFIPSRNLTPDDIITVRLNGNVAQSDGVGLDGNNNGIAEQSPLDDYVWSFQTTSPDITAPAFTIGVLQNPVFSRYMDIYIIGSEMLVTTPELTISGADAPLRLIPGEVQLYKADYRLEQNGVLTLQVSGADLAGNVGSSTRELAAQFLRADTGGDLLSADGQLTCHFPQSALSQDLFLTCMKKEAAGKAENTYEIGPANLSLQRPAEISFQLAPGEQEIYQLELQQADGSWVLITSEQEGGLLSARISRTGALRITTTNRMVPALFTLHQNYPNPFHLGEAQTTVTFELPQRQEVEIVIYNILGEQVRTLTKAPYAAGVHAIQWDGRRDDQRRVASGVYFYQCKMAQQTFTRKMLILQ